MSLNRISDEKSVKYKLDDLINSMDSNHTTIVPNNSTSFGKNDLRMKDGPIITVQKVDSEKDISK